MGERSTAAWKDGLSNECDDAVARHGMAGMESTLQCHEERAGGTDGGSAGQTVGSWLAVGVCWAGGQAPRLSGEMALTWCHMVTRNRITRGRNERYRGLNDNPNTFQVLLCESLYGAGAPSGIGDRGCDRTGPPSELLVVRPGGPTGGVTATLTLDDISPSARPTRNSDPPGSRCGGGPQVKLN